MAVPVGILTVSDKCSRGEAADTSGPALQRLLEEADGGASWAVAARQVVPDSAALIAETVRAWCGGGPGAGACGLVVVTGGTGISASDVTVQALEPLFTKRLGALATAMVVGSLRITPLAALSQVTAGVVGSTVVLAVPGSRKGAVENVQQILGVLPHAVDTARAVGGTRALHAADGAPARPAGGAAAPGQGQRRAVCGCARPDEGPGGPAPGLGGGVARRARRSPYEMIPVQAALELVLAHVALQPAEEVPLAQLRAGQVLAADVAMQEDVPGYPASVMDGYAVVAADGPGVYPVCAASAAGAGERRPLRPGEVARVATGAPVPPGADAVVMVEDTELAASTQAGDEELRVRILDGAQIAPGQNIRPVGFDLERGAVVARAGTVITAAGGEIGALATSGNRAFRVHRMPAVAVMSTGDEVTDTLGADPPAALPFGAIRDCNRPALLAALAALGCPAVDLGVVRDDPELLAGAIRGALATCQGVVTTGGVSMGERDWLKPVVEQRLGGTIHFGRVAMKPSKPTTFATVPGGQFVFALPGNPVSALVAFHMFVAPGLRKAAGHHLLLGSAAAAAAADPAAALGVLRPSVDAVFEGAEIALDRVRPEYVRGALAWDHAAARWVVRVADRRQQSSRMASMRGANALVSLPVGTDARPTVASGSRLTAIIIGAPHF
ncbi:hypothetical protein H4R18_000580 [Coemansia javaensis]|uniref:molybdopterin adenylyltransferase n=1 Tax=Coemansia javaensis TaxID=2761396 RepID=A0A9W8HGD8_9FUNG|nr:hypothetical protein H4R18_000580 [Coemansia javaensis]